MTDERTYNYPARQAVQFYTKSQKTFKASCFDAKNKHATQPLSLIYKLKTANIHKLVSQT